MTLRKSGSRAVVTYNMYVKETSNQHNRKKGKGMTSLGHNWIGQNGSQQLGDIQTTSERSPHVKISHSFKDILRMAIEEIDIGENGGKRLLGTCTVNMTWRSLKR